MEAAELFRLVFSSFTKGTSFRHIENTGYQSLIPVNLEVIGRFEYRLTTPELFSDSLWTPTENQCEEDHTHQSRGL